MELGEGVERWAEYWVEFLNWDRADSAFLNTWLACNKRRKPHRIILLGTIQTPDSSYFDR